jgi:hypothetical protein
VCKWHATYCWKALNDSYNFSLDFIAIRSLHEKLWGPKIARIQMVKISKLPLGSPRIKNHLDVTLWRGAEYTIRGKVVASPKSRLW